MQSIKMHPSHHDPFKTRLRSVWMVVKHSHRVFSRGLSWQKRYGIVKSWPQFFFFFFSQFFSTSEFFFQISKVKPFSSYSSSRKHTSETLHICAYTALRRSWNDSRHVQINHSNECWLMDAGRILVCTLSNLQREKFTRLGRVEMNERERERNTDTLSLTK